MDAVGGLRRDRGVRPACRPDAILLDVDMPLLDGFQVLSILRADPLTQDVPVLFLTGRVDTNELIEGLDLGAFDYVKKPCHVGELLARIKAALRWKARADELGRLAEAMDVLGSTDVLTGLPNRRALDRQLSVLAYKARATGGEVAVANSGPTARAARDLRARERDRVENGRLIEAASA